MRAKGPSGRRSSRHRPGVGRPRDRRWSTIRKRTRRWPQCRKRRRGRPRRLQIGDRLFERAHRRVGVAAVEVVGAGCGGPFAGVIEAGGLPHAGAPQWRSEARTLLAAASGDHSGAWRLLACPRSVERSARPARRPMGVGHANGQPQCAESGWTTGRTGISRQPKAPLAMAATADPGQANHRRDSHRPSTDRTSLAAARRRRRWQPAW